MLKVVTGMAERADKMNMRLKKNSQLARAKDQLAY